MTVPTGSPSLAALEDATIDSAVMGALEGTDDPNEAPDGSEAAESTVVDKASKAEASAEKADGKLKLLHETPEDAPTESKRNPDGTFAKTKPDAKAPAKVEAKAPTDGTPAPTETPEEPVAEAPKERRKLATDFKIRTSTGEELDAHDVVDQLGEIEIPWKKSRENPDGVLKAPLDKIARLAQAGIHNEEMYATAKSAIEEHQSLSDKLADAEERIKRQNAYVAQLLDSDEVLADSRAKWQNHNTPEARAERAERRAMELEQQLQGKQQADTGTSFYERDVKAPLDAIRSQYPTVTEAELEAQVNLLTRHLGSTIQPKDFAAVREIVRLELPAYAASVHETRSAHQTELRKAQEKLTLLKRSQAIGARPMGRVSSPSEAKPTRRPATNNDERIESIIDDEIAIGFGN